LPELSKIYQINDLARASKLQNNAVKIGLLLSLPAAFGIIALSEPIIHVIYERGAFTSEDTIKTAAAISAFAIGLPAFILTKILLPILYAHQDTKTPLKITLYSLAANTVLNLLLMKPFGHVGIALGSSIAAWYNVWLLYNHTQKNNFFSIDSSFGSFLGKVFLSCILMTLVICIIQHYYNEFFYSPHLFTKFITLGSTIVAGVVTFFSTILLFKLYPISKELS
jgi:putative peptidoglycan lipid II flippase